MSDENINININVVTKKSIREGGNEVDKLGNKGKNAGKKIDESAKKSSKALQQIEVASGFAIAGLVALTATAVKSLNAFKQFENGLINVQKVTNISGKNLASFGKEIDRLARRIPVGTSELLNIAQTAGQLGIEGAKNILAFTEAVALLTRTTDLTIDSAQSLAQLIEVTRTAPEDVGRLAAVVVDLGNNFSATESQILEVSTRIAQSTTQYGLLAEDAVALGAVIAGVGEKAEASGTAIGKGFRAFERAIALGGPPLEELTRITKLQRDELSRLFESDPTALLIKFTEGLNRAKKEGELVPEVLSNIGLKTDRVNRVFGPLIKNTERVREAFRRKNEQVENSTALIEEANKQFRSLESAEIQASNATTELAKVIGTSLEPAYRSILETVRSVSITITRFVEDNGPGLKILQSTVIGLGIAFASLATIATGTLLVIFAPIVALTAKLTLLGTAIGAIAIYWDDIALAGKKFAVDMLIAIEPVLDSFGKLASLIGISNETIESTKDSIIKYKDALTEEIKAQEESNKKKEEANRLDKIRTEQIRELENEQERLRQVVLTTEGDQAIAAQKRIKSIDEEIQAINNLSTEEKKVTLTRIDELNKLRSTREELYKNAETASLRDQKAILREIELIDQQIAKIRELNAVDQQKKEDNENQKRIDKIVAEEELLQARLIQIRKLGNDESTNGIREAYQKQSETKLKALRDEALAIGDLQAALRAEEAIDDLEETERNKQKQQKITDDAIKAKQDRIEKIKELETQNDEAEEEVRITKEAIKFEQDEQELEILNQNLFNQEFLVLESQKRKEELQKNHLAALRTQRKIDDLKRKQELKVRTDSEIREERAQARVKRVIAQTSAEQIIGIGDNLTKAGILQGKTAGKALQVIKIADATVSTFAGASKALELGFPAGPLAAASIVASGLANIATIKSQKFATGGIVQPAGTASRGIDNVPALLSVGEEVLTKNNPRHKDNISREQDQALLNAINGLRTDIQGMQTVVNIDGKEVADVIQEQRFRGVR